ncbi:MAG: histidine ammonia-lyase [Spirochaetales bacterium]|nr:histidine ammonia-lyase [Spirochaetales bacterium]
MIKLNGKLTFEDYKKIVYDGEKCEIDGNLLLKIDENRKIVDEIVKSKKVVYGINTGFGVLANTTISQENLENLQYNLIRSHSVGYGNPAPYFITRGTILLRLNSLLQAVSGIKRKSIEILCEALNKEFYPYVPEKGSLGASGDLAPLSHIILALIGEGECIVDGKRKQSIEVLKEKKIEPLKLSAKEGLALINGTPYMTAWYLNAIFEAEKLLFWANFCAGFSIENLNATLTPFKMEISYVRPHKGQIDVSKIIFNLFKDSPRIISHKNCSKVQDAYSLRCTPQVHGAVLNAIYDCVNVAKVEMNSATDNPLIFSEDKIYSQGNFHGEILALYADFLTIALSELASISERRIERLLNPTLSGLPGFLADDAGLQSGLMITQYTAAALVSENKVLSHPASVDSIPVSANQEDHVSMGANAVLKLNKVIENIYNVLAIELLSNIFAKRFYEEDYASITKFIVNYINKEINFEYKDHPFYKDIEKIVVIMKDDTFFTKVKNEFEINLI